ncbi:MAG: hypothetical protein H6745_08595 [Deltaproteobacteria bacterium]|nr:hypothetical protein [Deltaproteobacteria bacterium]
MRRDVLLTARVAMVLAVAGATPGPSRAAPEPRARVALVSLRDQAELGPERVRAVELALRGAAIDEDVDTIPVVVGPGERCDPGCLAGLAEPASAAFTLSGALARGEDGGYVIHLALRRAGETRPVTEGAGTADTPEGLVELATTEGRRLFATARDEVAPLPSSVLRRDARPERTGSRSVAVALTLEILFPGAGLAYAGDWGAFAVEYGGILGGFLMIEGGIGSEDDSALVLAIFGVTVLVAARVYGIMRAPAAAREYGAPDLEPRREGLRRLEEPDPGTGLVTRSVGELKFPVIGF